MTIPTTEELRAVIAAAASEPDATARSIAAAVVTAVQTRIDEEGERCAESGCPYVRVPGLERCAEHTAAELARLRALVRGE